jgi:2-oxoisovalerate dehydrogenase E1 component
MVLRSISAILCAAAGIALWLASWGGVRAAAKRPHFIDVAPRSKITYTSNNNYTGRKYFPQPMCGGVGILDFDNDGRMDIFFTNGAKLPELKKTDASFYNSLLRNKGDGTFEDVTAKAGISGERLDFSYGVAVGDYDNDGFPDIFVAAQIAGGDISNLLHSFPKLLVKRVDGTDLPASWQAMQEAVSWCRQKRGPALVHADVVRLYSHSLSDDERLYKTKDQREAEQARDPVPGFAAWLTRQEFLSEADLRGIEHEVDAEIQSATEQALKEDSADPSQNDRYLYSDVIDPSRPEFDAEPLPTGNPITMVDAINRTLADEMSRDNRILVFGEDVADLSDETKLNELKGKGGAFKVTYGLQRRFGSARCFNTPVTESAIIGRAIGMALRGLRPVVEIQFIDNIWRALLQIRNELAATRWRSFNSYSAPVIVRVPLGGYLSGGAAFHSQSGEVAFTHIPGLRVVMPSTAVDAAGLLRTALRCDDPVVFLEHKRLYREPYNRASYPGPDFTIPFGRAKVVKPGLSLTIVTYGALVQKSMVAANEIERRRPQSSIEVIDLRSLAPYDWNAIVLSVTKTSRVMIAYENWKSWGYGAELAARIARELFSQLDAPVGRVAAADRWIGYHPRLEDETLPQVADLVAEAEKILDY